MKPRKARVVLLAEDTVDRKDTLFSSEDDEPLVKRLNVPTEEVQDKTSPGKVKKDNEYLSQVKPKKNVSLEALMKNLKTCGSDIEVKLAETIRIARLTLFVKDKSSKVECPLCGDSFHEILGHLNRHASRPAFNCDKCDMSFTWKGRLLDHRMVEHKVGYACEVCNKRFKRKENIRIHMLTHETQGKFVCSTCGYVTKRRQCLTIHMMRHEDKWLCRCTICNKGFQSYATLQQHMNNHTGERPFTCDICGRNYGNSNTLWKHSRMYHPEQFQNIFKCKKCKKFFMRERSLREHVVKYHSKGDHFDCDICTKTFTTENSLMIHKRTHSNERPFTCKICDGAFTALRYLTKHMGVHKLKNFKCRFCYKKFVQEDNLMNHERKHEEVRRRELLVGHGFVASPAPT